MTKPTLPVATIFPSLSEAELRRLLQRADIAIGFAVEHLEASEMPAFLAAWRDGNDLAPWLPAASRPKSEPDNNSSPEAWIRDKEASLARLREPLNAIRFARQAIQPFETAAFLEDWSEGRNLMPWLNGIQEDLEAGGGGVTSDTAPLGR